MILELDAGNTRIKWRGLDESDGAILNRGSIPGQGLPDQVVGELMNHLDGNNAGQPSRVRVSSVRDTLFRDSLIAIVERKYRVVPEFAVVGKTLGGVTNSYEHVSRMGVDRWLAMLAAFERSRGACCVLDCGSAITFDWIDRNGMHQGGYIVPGIALMQQSLAAKTTALQVTLDRLVEIEPGSSSETAISHGTTAMATAFAEYCHKLVMKHDERTAWYLTGGDAGTVAANLQWPCTRIDELVLDGLALALP